MQTQITKKQHYVWRAYLSAWVHKNKIHCLREGKVFPSNLMGVAQERYFYRLQELNIREKSLIHQLAESDSHGALKQANIAWLHLFTFVFDLKEKINNSGEMNPELEETFRVAEIQLEEELHSAIEGRSKKYLDMLLNNDMSFYVDDEASMDFCFYFAMQYVRTPRILENMKNNITDIDGIDSAKVWSVLKIIYGTNISWAMYAKRSQYKLNILTSSTARFITADQPIINTHAVNYEEVPDKLEFFYPISPNSAVLISENNNEGEILEINEEQVQIYNQMMFDSSYKQIYAIEKSDLEVFLDAT